MKQKDARSPDRRGQHVHGDGPTEAAALFQRRKFSHRTRCCPTNCGPAGVSVRDDGVYEFRETSGPSNFSVYYRGDPRENEAALREALPVLYLSFVSQPTKK